MWRLFSLAMVTNVTVILSAHDLGTGYPAVNFHKQHAKVQLFSPTYSHFGSLFRTVFVAKSFKIKSVPTLLVFLSAAFSHTVVIFVYF